MKNIALLLLSSGSLIGCMRGGSTDNVDSASAAVDSQESVSDESDIMIASVDGSTPSGIAALEADQIAATIAANVAGRWPSGCATAVQTGADVTITYNDCTGPRGLVHVTGELDLTVSISSANGISVHATASDLEVNLATIDFTADGTLTTSGTMQSLAVIASGSGTGPRGNAIDHNGNYTVTWDSSDACRTIDGSWSTDLTTPVASAERANTVDLMRCGDACPSGTFMHKYLGGAVLNLTFNGTATASWTATVGATTTSGTIALTCTP